MFKKLKKNKKGFTLVELIVVLVILAILAALLIPALTGYIDKAKNKSMIAETRSVVQAAQTLVDEAYGKNDVGEAVIIGDDGDVTIADIKDLAEAPDEAEITVTLNKDSETNAPAGTQVSEVEYTKGSKTCTYKADWGNTKTTDGKYNITNN